MSKTGGVPLTTAQRKFVAALTQQAERMVIESGDPNGFAAAAWVRRWINIPNPALENRCPCEFFDDADGRARIVQLLAMAQRGAFS